MSTFNGVVNEFPDIRIDYFRRDEKAPAPLAFFLSHVHSDHLVGLESVKSPFIYCSPATREMLLKLEKYPRRMNFAKSILEARRRTYRHLQFLLRPIPLDTPTDVELSPGNYIRVTLFDANHCTGAVMFLIEGHDKAILYTGDIRSEKWWVDAISRNPNLLPYVSVAGKTSLRRLDTMYLDTTFATKSDVYSHFPSKAEGLLELLQKVSQYPQDTVFYFDTWTFGYEDVWQALSAFLRSKIHVDNYRYGVYAALLSTDQSKSPDGFRLVGSMCGNHFQGGCLTTRQARIHSCEKGTGCSVFGGSFVRITPVISRHHGMEIHELDAGGGQGDLNQQSQLEIEDDSMKANLMSLCVEKLQDQPQLLTAILKMLAPTTSGRSKSILLSDIALDEQLNSQQDDGLQSMDELPIERLVELLAKQAAKASNEAPPQSIEAAKGSPQSITFPYSRHSSYTELCRLVEVFLPKNIYPCTVDERNWDATRSMEFLFGHLYTGPISFSHDKSMRRKQGAKCSKAPSGSITVLPQQPVPPMRTPRSCTRNDMLPTNGNEATFAFPNEVLNSPAMRIALRQEAHDAALGVDGMNWWDIGLVSVQAHRQKSEEL